MSRYIVYLYYSIDKVFSSFAKYLPRMPDDTEQTVKNSRSAKSISKLVFSVLEVHSGMKMIPFRITIPSNSKAAEGNSLPQPLLWKITELIFFGSDPATLHLLFPIFCNAYG